MVDLNNTYAEIKTTISLSLVLDIKKYVYAKYGELYSLYENIEKLTENDNISWQFRQSLKSELESLEKQKKDYLALHETLWTICENHNMNDRFGNALC